MRPNMRRRPEGFAAEAETMTVRALMQKYRCGKSTVERWKTEVGFHPGPGRRKRPVAQYDAETGELLRVWPSVTEAAKGIYGTPSMICDACRGRHKMAYGFVWKHWNGKAVTPDVLRKRQILARLKAFARASGRGWCGAVAKATGHRLKTADVFGMYEAGKYTMAQWETLARALDKLEAAANE